MTYDERYVTPDVGYRARCRLFEPVLSKLVALDAATSPTDNVVEAWLNLGPREW